jgi:hypothetical protein
MERERSGMPATKRTRENPAQHLTIQEAFTQTVYESLDVHGNLIPAKEVADRSGIPIERLREMADGARGRKPHAEAVHLVVNATENYVLPDTMEYLMGRVGFLVPRIVGAGDVLALCGKSAAEFGAFLRDVAKFDADGTWTDDELRKAEVRRDQLFAAVSATLDRAARDVRRIQRPA